MFGARRLALGFVLLLLAGGSWWLTREAERPPVAQPAPAEPDYVIEDFVARALNARGEHRYVLSAERLTHYPADDTAHLVAPVLVQHLSGGVRVTTRAETGIMPGDGREILMRGNVRVERTAGGASAGGEVRAEEMRIELER